MLSYQPPSTLSFNVPVRPEGLPGADSFAVYAGGVRTAADLTQATPSVGRVPVRAEHLHRTRRPPRPIAREREILCRSREVRGPA
jgi:hypothetical protein